MKVEVGLLIIQFVLWVELVRMRNIKSLWEDLPCLLCAEAVAITYILAVTYPY